MPCQAPPATPRAQPGRRNAPPRTSPKTAPTGYRATSSRAGTPGRLRSTRWPWPAAPSCAGDNGAAVPHSRGRLPCADARDHAWPETYRSGYGCRVAWISAGRCSPDVPIFSVTVTNNARPKPSFFRASDDVATTYINGLAVDPCAILAEQGGNDASDLFGLSHATKRRLLRKECLEF